MTITTQDCKDFLIKHYQDQGIETTSKEWKRVSKYKDGGVVKRDFSHSSLGTVVVDETNNTLAISTKISPTVVVSQSTFIQRDFTLKEKQGAKKLVDYYNKILEDGEDWDDVETHDLWPLNHQAVPSQFFFFFPKDTYDNHEDNIDRALGLDTPMNVESGLCVVFYQNNGEFDEYDNGILHYGSLLGGGSFCDECHYTLDSNNHKTVREFMAELFSRGYGYRGHIGEYDGMQCLFEEEMKKVTIENQIFSTSLDHEKVITAKLIKAVKKDNVQELDKLITAGADINISLPKYENNLLSLAMQEDSEKCTTYLLDKGIDMFKYHHGTMVCNEVSVKNNFTEILAAMQTQLPNDNLYTAISWLLNIECSYGTHTHYKSILAFMNKNLSHEEVNSLILENTVALTKFDVPTLMKALKESSAEKITATILDNITAPYVATWLLGQYKIDISAENMQASWKTKNQVMNVVDFVKEQMQEAVDGLKAKQGRFIMVEVHADGTRISDIDKLNNKYNSYNKLLSAIDRNKTRPKP